MTQLIGFQLRLALLGSMLLWPILVQAQPQPADSTQPADHMAPADYPQDTEAADRHGDAFGNRPPFEDSDGPRFGPPPGGPPPEMSDPFKWPDALDRWKDEDRRLQESVSQFKNIEGQRTILLKALSDEKSQYDPERMDTQALLARQKVNNILAQLHELVEQDKKNVDEASRLFGFTAISMKFWGPVFKERLHDESDTLDPKVLTRLRLWVEGYEKSKQQEDPEALAITLLGDDFGPIVYQTSRERLEKMIGEARLGRGGPHRGPGRLKESQGRWIVRIQRLEKRQEDMQNELDGLGREIERLRRMVESDASWPVEPDEKTEPATNDKQPAAIGKP